MQFGYFTMPSHPPERPLKDGHEWDLQVIRWLDELGFAECWIGEHHTAPWEPHPSPDLLVAQGLMQTKNIRLGPGGFLLPYHHPAELANRVAMLDHISGGRLNFGVAASGLPSDWAMFNVDGMSGVNRDMTREALEIILKLWSSPEPFDYKGKFWHVTKPDTMFQFLKPHLKPLQSPHPPIGVAGLSKGSDTLKLAGEKGFLPMSLNLSPAYVGSHWEAVEIGAAKAGRTPDRGEWRMVREVFVADSDEEAFKLSAGSYMGRMMREYFLPLLGQFGFLDYLKHDPGVADSDVTPDYCARHNWIIGSPRTVTRAVVEGGDAQSAASQAKQGQIGGRIGLAPPQPSNFPPPRWVPSTRQWAGSVRAGATDDDATGEGLRGTAVTHRSVVYKLFPVVDAGCCHPRERT
jgi:alkanesulfonate monooxygenase SsuD/methylene tetrahydromethanopterin reductase-like flavin-dependent oxidoreductase (luciferase family)